MDRVRWLSNVRWSTGLRVDVASSFFLHFDRTNFDSCRSSKVKFRISLCNGNGRVDVIRQNMVASNNYLLYSHQMEPLHALLLPWKASFLA